MEKSHFQWTNFWGAGHTAAYRDQDASIWTQLYSAIVVNMLCQSTAHTDGGRIFDVVVIFLRQRLVPGVATSTDPGPFSVKETDDEIPWKAKPEKRK